jgi:ABC-type transport system involved in multi-copper enzyme maturation permease subunit
MYLVPFNKLELTLLVLGIALLALFVILASTRGLSSMWHWLLGPIFFYEMVRLARKGRTIGIRCLYALILLLVIFALHPVASDRNAGSMPIHEMELFGQHLSHYLLTAQYVIVLLLAPIYFAAAISSERENRSLDFLLASPLHNHQIILGKLAARWLHLFGILLAGLPILALTQLWGGVDLVHLLAGTVVLGLTLLSLGSLSLLVSVLMKRSWSAIGISYAIGATVGLCCGGSFLSSPIAFQMHLEQIDILPITPPASIEPDEPKLNLKAIAVSVGEYAAVHGTFEVVCLGWSMRRMRTRMVKASHVTVSEYSSFLPEACALRQGEMISPGAGTTSVENATEFPKVMVAHYSGQVQFVLTGDASRRPPPKRVVMPPVGENPLLWKELYLGRSAEIMVVADLLWLYFIVIVVFLAIACVFSAEYSEPGDRVRPSLAVGAFGFIMLLSALLVVRAGTFAAASVSREREQRTLETLCSLPFTRMDILQAKWLGTIWIHRRSLIGLAVLFVLVAACGVYIIPLLLLLGTLVAHTVFAVGLGLFLSVYCRTTMRAYIIWAVVLLVITASSFVLGEVTSLPRGSQLGELLFQVQWWLVNGINPITTWYELISQCLYAGRRPGGYDRVQAQFACLIGLAVYLIAAVWLRLAAGWFFRREGDRG